MLDRTIAPKYGVISFPDLQQVERMYGVDGAPLYVLSAGAAPVVKVEFVFKSGLWYENMPCISWLAAKMSKAGLENVRVIETQKHPRRYKAIQIYAVPASFAHRMRVSVISCRFCWSCLTLFFFCFVA